MAKRKKPKSRYAIVQVMPDHMLIVNKHVCDDPVTALRESTWDRDYPAVLVELIVLADVTVNAEVPRE